VRKSKVQFKQRLLSGRRKRLNFEERNHENELKREKESDERKGRE
jgi:hypothetical protein